LSCFRYEGSLLKAKFFIRHYTLHITMSTTTVRIDKETRDMLKEVGSKGQTYDEIIQEMLELRRIFIEDLYSILEETEEDEWLTTEELRKELE